MPINLLIKIYSMMSLSQHRLIPVLRRRTNPTSLHRRSTTNALCIVAMAPFSINISMTGWSRVPRRNHCPLLRRPTFAPVPMLIWDRAIMRSMNRSTSLLMQLCIDCLESRWNGTLLRMWTSTKRRRSAGRVVHWRNGRLVRMVSAIYDARAGVFHRRR